VWGISRGVIIPGACPLIGRGEPQACIVLTPLSDQRSGAIRFWNCCIAKYAIFTNWKIRYSEVAEMLASFIRGRTGGLKIDYYGVLKV
jgi:hypothetical protein